MKKILILSILLLVSSKQMFGAASTMTLPDSKFKLVELGNKLQLWNIKTCKFVMEINDETFDIGTDMAMVSQDDKELLIYKKHYELKIWDIETGQLLEVISPGPKAPISPIILNLKDQFNIITDKLIEIITADNAYINIASMSSDNKYLATASGDQAKIWDVQTGEALQMFKHIGNTIFSISISSDNKFIVTGASDCKARIWDAKTGEILRIITLDIDINSIEISSDNRSIIVKNIDGNVKEIVL